MPLTQAAQASGSIPAAKAVLAANPAETAKPTVLDLQNYCPNSLPLRRALKKLRRQPPRFTKVNWVWIRINHIKNYSQVVNPHLQPPDTTHRPQNSAPNPESLTLNRTWVEGLRPLALFEST